MGNPRLSLGENGVPLGPKKWVKTVKITMPKTSNFRLPRGHRFFATNGSYGYGAKSRWGHPRIHLGANGVPLGPKKWVKTVKIYHVPKLEFSTNRGHRFFAEMEVAVMAPNYGGDPLRSILGPMGFHCVPKMGQNRKNHHAQNIDFSQQMEVTVMAPNHGGVTLGSILGPMGSHWVQKNGSKL